MNDLSVLYPLAKTRKEFDAYLPAQGLLPPDIYAVASAGFSSPTSHAPSFDALRLVAFRLDPCTGQKGPVATGQDAQCLNELRLIF